MSSDIPEAGLPVMQAGGMHPATDLLTAPAIGGASGGHEHPPAVVEGRAGRPATVRASAGCPACRGPDPSVRRLFVLDGARRRARPSQADFRGGHPPSGAAGDLGRNIRSACPGVCMQVAAGRFARPGSLMMPAGRRRFFAGLPAASSGRLLVSPDRFPRPRRDPHGGPARIAAPRGLSAVADPEGRTGEASPGRCGNHRHRLPRTGGMMINRRRWPSRFRHRSGHSPEASGQQPMQLRPLLSKNRIVVRDLSSQDLGMQDDLLFGRPIRAGS